MKILRPAIAMIELIFAIAVMGIAMMSAPMLLSTSSKSTEVVLQQEGINEAVSQANIILTYPWDQNDTMDECIPPMLLVSNGDSELDRNVTTGRRNGVDINSSAHSFLCKNNTYNASSSLGKEGNIIDDMDDFKGSTTLNNLSGGSGGIDYLQKNTVNISTNINYISDSANYSGQTITFTPSSTSASGSTNIKLITINITSNPGGSDHSLDSDITLKAFSCNLGGYEYAHRTIQ